MTRCIVARYTDTINPDDQRFLYGPSKPTSHVNFVSSDLHWVEEIKNLVRLDISCNYLSQLDLSPLEGNKTLKYLDLSENAIESIDLSPLNSCEKLETLDLSYNRIEDVSLTPLVTCKSLRFVYLHRNNLDTINIAPLMHLKRIQKVIIDNMKSRKPVPVFTASVEDPPPNLNDVLYAMSFKTSRPEWLCGIPDATIIKLKTESYKKIVKKHGWESVKTHLKAALPLIPLRSDFSAQSAILRDLGIPELACYDGSISDIIEIIPTEGTYTEGTLEIQSKLIAMLSEQIENGGSTLFFDIDKLSTTPGSVLVPQIVSQRAKELKELVLYQYADRVNLMPMWLTGFGFNILKAAQYGREELETMVPDILEKSASAIGISIPLKQTKSKKKFDSLGATPSKPLLDHLLSIVPHSSSWSST
ncbi:MAG: leucine-rich repeat domain-containing protein [Candidatus Thorarchaeota archaeon]